MIGKVVSHYKILEKLGEGGMGVVYKAEDTRLKRTVALKFLPHGLESHEPERARFLQEAQAASALNHPNVCTIYDIGEAEGHQFIAMECVEGVTLRSKIEAARLTEAHHEGGHKRLKIEDYIKYAIQIGEALEEAHTHGILHRDVKTDNIMVNSKGQIKVMDFGLARLKGSLKLTRTTSTVGTLAYMAPEQIEGRETDARSDIFSFGVVLYELLTGRLPFRGEHEAAMMYSIVNEEPEPIETDREGLSPVLANLIQRALEKDPDDRYQSMHDLVIELKRLHRETSKVVRRSSEVIPPVRAPEGPPAPGGGAAHSGPPAGKSRRLLRNRLAVLGIAVLAVIMIVAAVTQFVMRKEPGGERAFSIQSMEVTRLTSDGKARSAAVSPDGKYVVYSTVEGGKHGLWVRQVATNSTVQIIPFSKVYFRGLAFSRDGNYLFYVMMQESTGRSAAYRIPVLGGTPRKILDNVEGPFGLSPDDEEFSFVRYYPTTGEFTLMVAKTDGSEERRLASHKADLWFYNKPAWSPDGTVIACPLGSEKGGQHYTVVTVSVDGAVEKHFTQTAWDEIYRLEWLPGGGSLLMQAKERRSPMAAQIFQLSYPGGEATRITNDLLDYSSLSLSHDAQTLCVVQGDIRGNILALPGGSAARARQVTSGRDEGLSGLAWTPDGRLVYVSSASGAYDLWLMDADGKNRRQLTADAASDFDPVVSPDGKFILFTTNRSGIYNIWRIDIDGSKARQLTGPGECYGPSISPDGTWFVFSSWAKGPVLIMKEPTEGGESVQLSETNGSSPSISPDGTLVAYVSFDEQTRNRRIEIMRAEGGKPVKEFDLPHTATDRLRWSHDGQAVQFVVDASGSWNVWNQPLSGGPPKQVTEFTSDYLSMFDWSPDGKLLAVSRYFYSGDVVLMSNRK
jgi:Tol biopolymer transport system component/predicted Ser/Thr protein kinase